MAGVRDWYCALVSVEVPCFLKAMRPYINAILYYEPGNDHDSLYVKIGSTIADLDLQDVQCPLLLKSICNQQTYNPTKKKW